MIELLKKFNNLPKDLRDKISSSFAMQNINNLEKKYEIDLAAIIMKIMTKDVVFKDLHDYFKKEFNFSEEKSRKLSDELLENVFKDVKAYLGVSTESNQIKKFSDFDPGFPKRQINKIDSVKNSDYLFSPEDEEEIRELTKKINNQGELKNNNDIQKKVDIIIREAGINFGASYLEQRFKDIISTCLKGIRGKIDTRIALGKTLDEGGLGFDNDSIDEILFIIDKVSKPDFKDLTPIRKVSFSEIEKEGAKEKKDILKQLGARDADYNLEKALLEKSSSKKISAGEEKENKKDYNFGKKLDLSHELAPPPPKIIAGNEIKVFADKADEAEKINIKKDDKFEFKKENKLSPLPPAVKKDDSFRFFGKSKIGENKNLQDKKEKPISRINIPTGLSGKKIMKDVSVVPRVMNPIDELRFMDLITFRRLGQNAGQIIEKINNKIKLLEEDRYSKRVEGIKAWRSSPVNRLYLSIGEESISKNKAINAIIEDRIKNKKDYLTEDEFNSIMDLNKDLRF